MCSCKAFTHFFNFCVVFTLTFPNHDESSSIRHVRRMFHPGRGLGGSRARRTNMHFTSSSTGGLSSSSSQSSTYTPSNREAMDPIAGEVHQPFLHHLSSATNYYCVFTSTSIFFVNPTGLSSLSTCFNMSVCLLEHFSLLCSFG